MAHRVVALTIVLLGAAQGQESGCFFCCSGSALAGSGSGSAADNSSWPCTSDLAAARTSAVLRAAEVALGGLADCNVEVIDAKARTWKASYWPRVLDVIAGRPLLIRNAPPELFELVRELSHRDTLVQTFGSEVLRVRDSSPFTVMWGLDSSVDAVNRQLGEVVEGLFGSAVAEGSSPRDVFSLQQTKMHGLFPRLFPYEKSVSLGLPGTGLTFHHAHGQAFLALVHGKKRWYLLR